MAEEKKKPTAKNEGKPEDAAEKSAEKSAGEAKPAKAPRKEKAAAPGAVFPGPPREPLPAALMFHIRLHMPGSVQCGQWWPHRCL